MCLLDSTILQFTKNNLTSVRTDDQKLDQLNTKIQALAFSFRAPSRCSIQIINNSDQNYLFK